MTFNNNQENRKKSLFYNILCHLQYSTLYSVHAVHIQSKLLQSKNVIIQPQLYIKKLDHEQRALHNSQQPTKQKINETT